MTLVEHERTFSLLLFPFATNMISFVCDRSLLKGTSHEDQNTSSHIFVPSMIYDLPRRFIRIAPITFPTNPTSFVAANTYLKPHYMWTKVRSRFFPSVH